VMEVRRRVFSPPYPTATALVVSGLVNPDWLVEIDAMAHIA
jgi:enamine deaminase RidA (YjgF/YER057c/UK114 family)